MTIATALRLVTVMGLWAACFPLITVGLHLAPHLAFATLRAVLAGACLVALAVVLGRPLPRSLRSWALVALVGVGATSLGFFGMFHAAEFISPGLATVIANTQPLLAAVLAYTILGERLMALGKAGLVIGLSGIAAIAWPGLTSASMQDYSLGIAYVILAALGVAVGNIAIKRLTGTVDAIMAMGLQMLIGALPLTILSMVTEDLTLLAWTAEFLALLAILSVAGTSLPFWLWFRSLEQVDLNRANAFTFLVPILGLAIGAALFGERLAWIQVAGVALVLSGIALVQFDAAAAVKHYRN
jgi:drug/metabolite transporter (DMT)-like permease